MQLSRYLADFKAQNRSTGANRAILTTVDSTNILGKRVAAACLEAGNVPPPMTIIALSQTMGRGRLDRDWWSPMGGIYASVIRSVDDRQQLWKLPLIVAIALCAELDQIVEAPCRLKWPNDLIVANRKIGGILIESVSRAQEVAVVVGFGINYSADLGRMPVGATSVQCETGSAPELGGVTARLLDALERELARLTEVEGLAEEFSRWSLHRTGDTLACRTVDGMHRGRFLGFDRRGFLRLETPGGECRISAGDVIEESGAVA